MRLQSILLSFFLFMTVYQQTIAQNLAFDNLNANGGTTKAISWTSSLFGNGFGHRIINVDPGEMTTLNFQARHNSSTWQNSMIITSTGFVGVGGSNPLYPFHVSAAIGQRSRFQYGGTGIDLVDYTSNTNGFSNSAGMYVTGKDALVMSDQGYNLRFVTNETGPFVERMRILPNGNIGIGVTNPTNKFEVNGTIKTREVSVTTAGWADYVFDPGYKLMPLSDVEAFIQKNGHLPNMPSEKDVMEGNGVNLMEMNIKLLEKIEELTLYIIDQQKIIEQLKSKIE